MRIEILDTLGKSHFYDMAKYFVQENKTFTSTHVLRVYEKASKPICDCLIAQFYNPVGYKEVPDA